MLPKAISGNWPLNPDFSLVFDRVCCDYLALATVAGSGVSDFLMAAKEHYGVAYNQDAMLSQYADGCFLESGAGYYGEAGYQIIISALRHLFPPQSVNLVQIHPLKYDTFLQEVLAHEAAVSLIETDLGISYAEAIKVFRESCTFGNHMHKSDDPEIEPFIAAAVRQVSRSTPHTTSDF
ncbi:hypothetical protein GALMADRAFT_145530 [Galerina marginata CBS 339.88]|uniref:Restriction of telomere capping protein 4 n=1 Tax=Galerina marginata (strain CBS 339.88) TaxID=685588 RepID=A0A067SRW3_GALM3|nr:hypothetical protein GALMADRAFT_145530 [Galerina marginata CBS 339.88]